MAIRPLSAPASAPVRTPVATRRRINRLVILAFFLLLAIPVTVQAVRDGSGSAGAENRKLAVLPGWPTSWADAVRLPAALNAYIDDNFGLRRELIAANNLARFRLFHELTTRQLAIGRQGRVFFTSHAAAQPDDLFRVICDIQQPPDAAARAAEQTAHILAKARAAHPRTFYMLVPTAPALYPQQLPGWVRPDCTQRPMLAERAAALLTGQSGFVYPLAPMRRIGAEIDIIPPTHFHWHGQGIRLTAEDFVETHLGLPRRVTVPETPQPDPSDIARLNPGIRLVNSVQLPDFAAAGIERCLGAACFPKLAAIAPWIADSSHYQRAGGPPQRLLLISDSFGASIAGYFAEYFTEVVHFSTNDLAQFRPEDVTLFKNFAWNDYRPDVVLLLFHDGAIFYGPYLLNRYLWPD